MKLAPINVSRQWTEPAYYEMFISEDCACNDGWSILVNIVFELPAQLAEEIRDELLDSQVFLGALRRESWSPSTRRASDAALAWLEGLSTSEFESVVDSLKGCVPIHRREQFPESLARGLVMRAVASTVESPWEVFRTAEDCPRVRDILPGLECQRDKSGLLSVDLFDELHTHYLRIGDVYLQYHPFLRRGFGGTVNYLLTHQLLECAQNPALATRVAIDWRRYSRAKPQVVMEFDHWYGLPLTIAGIDDVSATGTTRHARVESELPFDFALQYTDFQWTSYDGLKGLEIEEMIPHRGPEPVMNRYIHSERNVGTRRFTHLDGAVRGYEGDAYAIALDSTLAKRTKAPRYRKVFRVDGNMSDDGWLALVTMWFRFNELVGEYLHPGFISDAISRWGWDR